MLNYYYTDTNGQKQGPFNEQQLQTLAARGSITAQTMLETDAGHKGAAGQIPGLFPAAPSSPFTPAAQPAQAAPIPTPAANVFCTNCGKPLAVHVVACMSCGAKPTGHKKFCRQCGVVLNPEQVVCVKCGNAVSGGSIWSMFRR